MNHEWNGNTLLFVKENIRTNNILGILGNENDIDVNFKACSCLLSNPQWEAFPAKASLISFH